MSAIPDQTSAQTPIQLSWEGPKVVVAPEDQDRFMKELQRAILNSQNGLALERFCKQLRDEFLPAIYQWCDEHRDRVEACYVPFPTDHVRVFVITRSQSYDFTLSDDLTALEMELFDKHWPADINQIPNSPPTVLETFFKPAASIRVYANSG